MLNIRNIVVAAVAASTVVGASFGPAQAASRSKPQDLTTPLGITLQEKVAPNMYAFLTGDGAGGGAAPVKKTPGFQARGTGRSGAGYVLADAKGMTLYTYAKDTVPGKSSCVDECAQAWPPAIVAAGAQATGYWSIIKRDDGSKQWAYQGKPVYTFTKDQAFGGTKGNGLAENAWHTVNLQPEEFVQRPYGIEVREAKTAAGYILAANGGIPIYIYSGKGLQPVTNCVTTVCAKRWLPVEAPLLGNAIGEFTMVNRPDGVRQWAYKGKPLFTYSGDLMPGDALGIGVSKDVQLALVTRNFMPADVGMYFDSGRGAIITTKDGHTIYRLDTSFHTPDGHGLPGSYPGAPSVGRLMGTAACDGDCLKEYRPLVAAADALPSGHWSIMTRSDGTRQWAYKGFATYTYVGDKKPGDRAGADNYLIYVYDNAQQRDVYKQTEYGQAVSRGSDTPAVMWAYVEP